MNEAQDAPNLLKRVRVAVHAGSAVPFRDVKGRLNSVGNGMNETTRLLSLSGESLAAATTFANGEGYAVASTSAVQLFRRRYNPPAE